MSSIEPSTRPHAARTFVDRGGTFTDVVHIDADGHTTIVKVRSDEAVVGELARGRLTFGTTVATNALLEGRGVPTLLVISEGFADLPHVRDMTRPALFDPTERWPEPLTRQIVEVGGRLGVDGAIREPLGSLPPHDGEVQAVAIVLLHGPSRPEWELELARQARARWPEAHISLGHQIAPRRGYLARVETTLVDAAITPILAQAVRADRIAAEALAIRSDGSLCPALELRAPDAVLSGPAGGVVAVASLARHLGEGLVVGFDMGGTSTDVCLIRDGQIPRRSGHQRVAGTALSTPVLEVHTIAAGGGSVLHHDGVQLRVGPRSAGADPGPQCYGRGGPPTVTDAALAAGRVAAQAFSPPLQPAAVELPATAEAFLAVAHEQMAGAIRALAAARAEDVTEGSLMAFGGAAGQHAADVATRLGMSRVWVHPAASVLSAYGQALARREERAERSLWCPLGDWDHVERAWSELEASLPALGEVHRVLEVRYVGTDASLTVQAAGPDEAAQAFAAEHRRLYGFEGAGELEVVDVRVRVTGPAPEVPALPDDPWGLGEGVTTGPVRLDTPTTSVWVPAGWQACRDRGLLRLDRVAPAARPAATTRTAEATALWSQRIRAVATDAGVVLRRLARSVNVRERLDFSCAVFDGDGQLVANAPHVPVHLGAMGSTVRHLLAHGPPLEAGQHYLCNDPQAGGSHLPDLTVVHPTEVDGHRLFVANRAHHVDVGGLVPGSMPPHSRSLDDEGFVVQHLPLLVDGRLRADLDDHLVGCRERATVRADLLAQVAANVTAARQLRALGPAVVPWCAHLLDAGEDALLDLLDRLAPSTAQDHLDGQLLHLDLRVTHDRRLLVDLRASAGPSPRNLNAPEAVVRAAVLYALRVITGRDVPLNDGLMRRVDVRTRPDSLLCAPAGAAIAGGNVETSQRVVDLVFAAAGFMAASAGTMSNLTLGGPGWSLYETVGGGQGASAVGPGPSARQVHMTNTRATDPEILEARLPLAVRRFARRVGSGGAGRHGGGDGLVRELEVLAPATAALLATRRGRGAPGLQGGLAGLPRADEARIDGTWRPWDGAPLQLQPGDRVRVVTPGGGGWGPPEDGS